MSDAAVRLASGTFERRCPPVCSLERAKWWADCGDFDPGVKTRFVDQLRGMFGWTKLPCREMI
jgi:hypothetical protein